MNHAQQTYFPRRRSPRIIIIPLIGVLWAAFALRLQNLGVQSLWYDETVSAYLATKPLIDLIAHTARDIHPPLYYILLHFWQALIGSTEFSLAYFSLWWGVLLVASSTTFARWLGGNHLALLTAALITLSPFNVWYSQEVRMYTLGATLGIWTLMALWQLMQGTRMKKRWMLLWLISAVFGLYTLYYFAFLLLWEAFFVLWWLWRNELLSFSVNMAPANRIRAGYRRAWVTLAVLVVVLWSPWIPIAWQQATDPPVPPWREGTSLALVLLEGMSALVLGQSAEYIKIWPMILLLFLVMLIGLWFWWQHEKQAREKNQQVNQFEHKVEQIVGDQSVLPTSYPLFGLSLRHDLALLIGSLLLPVLILIFSSYTPAPLYHVRYLFTYSPVFYILLAMAFIGCMFEAYRWGQIPGFILMGGLLLTPLLILSGESLQRFWHDTTYAADDLRDGIKQIETRWSNQDLLLINAGYTYTALNYYFDDPIASQIRLSEWKATDLSGQEDDEEQVDGLVVLQNGSIDGDDSLGWGLEESDFYAISASDTVAQLDAMTTHEEGVRLWQFRLYDTVTDPMGLTRDWLEQNGLLFYEQVLSGESNARVQGWYFPINKEITPERMVNTRFFSSDDSNTPSIVLHGTDEPTGPRTGGSWVDIDLWLEGHVASDPDIRLSLGLFDTTPAHRQWAVTDEKPLGDLLSLSTISGPQRWPVRLRLPQGIPPGKYDALLKFYRPSDQAILTADGQKVESNGQQVAVAVVEVGSTPSLERAPQVETPLNARFGPLELLGYMIPPGPWEPGASISVELVWRLLEPASNVRAFITSEILLSDDGGIANTYAPDEWRPGEVVRDIHYITVAPNPAPGEYPLYLRVGQGTETVAWTQGLFRNGEVLQLGNLTIKDRLRAFQPPNSEQPLEIIFGESMELIGMNTLAETYQAGTSVRLKLDWHATVRPPGRYKIFTHLIGSDGNLYAQRDLEPGDGLLPTNGWARGEYVSTDYTIGLPADLIPGDYTIRVGLYDPNTNERVLPVGVNADGIERYVDLGTIQLSQ